MKNTTLGSILLLSVASPCLAAPPGMVDPESPLHVWFEKQHSVAGAWCCDISDGHMLEDDEWDQNGKDGAYRIHVNGRWYEVPADAARDPKGGPNPTGKAIAWWNPTQDGIHIYCFAPGFMY